MTASNVSRRVAYRRHDSVKGVYHKEEERDEEKDEGSANRVGGENLSNCLTKN